MEHWRDVWRRWAAPLLSTEGLEALRVALAEDSPELLQGRNTKADDELPDSDDECTGACPLAYAGWKAEALETVEEVEAWFAGLVNEISTRSLEPAAASCLLGWIDDTPRSEMRRELLIETGRELARRAGGGEGRE
jgi:hypothetical protein